MSDTKLDEGKPVAAPKKKPRGFQKGQVANPHGRPKGSKSKAVELRKAIEESAMSQVGDQMPALLQRAFDMSNKGSESMTKFLLERFLPKAMASEDAVGKGFGGIVINVTSMDDVKVVPPIDGELDDQPYKG